MSEPSEADVEATIGARLELDAMKRIVDALEPLDGESRERVMATSAILSGVASIEAVRTVLYSVLAQERSR